MKFPNMFETEHINVLPGKLYDGMPYVGITASAGPLQFVWTMSPAQTRAMGQHMVELADQSEAELIAKQGIEMAGAA